MKERDLIVAMRLSYGESNHLRSPTKWLADELGFSTSKVHESLNRLYEVKLVSRTSGELHVPSFMEFVDHGMRFVFPAQLGQVVGGVPTATSAPPLDAIFPSGDSSTQYVWPSPRGTIRGTALTPFHPRVPEIAIDSRPMHERLALLDAIRLGVPRFRQQAVLALNTLLEHNESS